MNAAIVESALIGQGIYFVIKELTQERSHLNVTSVASASVRQDT